MKVNFELELNSAWIYDGVGETVGETNFVVPYELAEEFFEAHNGTDFDYDDFEDFLECYEPEYEGQEIYEIAFKEGKLIEDKKVNLY